MTAQPRIIDLSMLLEEEEAVPLNQLPESGSLGSTQESEGPPRKKRRIDQRGCHWFLTWNNPPRNGLEILREIADMCVAFVFQLEQGASGTPHWQGCFSFKDQKYWSSH